jgi:hypothetical protein
MLGTPDIDVPPNNSTLLIDPNNLCGTHTSRRVDRAVYPLVINKSVYHTTGILILPYDLS